VDEIYGGSTGWMIRFCPIDEHTPEEWQLVMDEREAVYWAARHVIPIMINREVVPF